ncbi:MAG: hypothetical protein M0R17_03270 [Candidatus Omnitrophica bacterium]|jgi:glucan-binding YG repeat protein|nr:hypothetical protein [Candidatus Omnitrophota bacterium]
MKYCKKCNRHLDDDKFWKRKLKTKTVLQPYCIDCSTKRRLKYYQDHKIEEKNTRKTYENGIREWYIDLKKTLSCKNCRDDRWYVLDFHHVDPANKDFEVSMMGRCSKTKILEEIDKCIILCANCHRELHFKSKQ